MTFILKIKISVRSLKSVGFEEIKSLIFLLNVDLNNHEVFYSNVYVITYLTTKDFLILFETGQNRARKPIKLTMITATRTA